MHLFFNPKKLPQKVKSMKYTKMKILKKLSIFDLFKKGGSTSTIQLVTNKATNAKLTLIY